MTVRFGSVLFNLNQDMDFIHDPEEPDAPNRESIPALDAIDQQRLSLYILTQRDRPIPSLAEMKKFLELPEDEAAEIRIKELNEQYEEDLERLYMAQAEDYIDDAEDRYYSLDDTLLPNDNIEALYSRFRQQGCNPQLEWDYARMHTTSVYNQRMGVLTGIRSDIDTNEALQRKKAEMDFPQSAEQYRLRPKESQHRVAHFLVLESDEQREKMLSEFDWAWRQVKPLMKEFESDKEFEAEIRATVTDWMSKIQGSRDIMAAHCLLLSSYSESSSCSPIHIYVQLHQPLPHRNRRFRFLHRSNLIAWVS
ncbi:hypothetical protein B0H10DRAFT_1397919 [Mycena sp. CBHHK59/15]|nr:hypothetical protein B0H10DRAFT_1397919 [Mycena sp. CBHHK59/15]